MEDYRTIRGTAIGEYEEKKSRFIAQLAFADSEEKAVAFLEQVRAANRTARHNVYAYRLREGNRERYSDDGEPAKTAGTPALEVLQHSGLTDLIVVVTRYFGGVLLGTGGLVRAYTTATARALENADTLYGKTDKKHDEMPVCVYDMLSILLQARSYDPSDYKPGVKILFSMATGRAIEKQTLIYRGKENFTSEQGVTYRCLVFSLVEYVNNKEKEVITFYVTDDRNHLPVRLDMYLNFGSAKAFLTDIKGNRHPLTSIVK